MSKTYRSAIIEIWKSKTEFASKLIIAGLMFSLVLYLLGVDEWVVSIFIVAIIFLSVFLITLRDFAAVGLITLWVKYTPERFHFKANFDDSSNRTYLSLLIMFSFTPILLLSYLIYMIPSDIPITLVYASDQLSISFQSLLVVSLIVYLFFFGSILGTVYQIYPGE